ncbi:MAG: D-ribose pyranase [Chitinispirillaceae bacterium]
MKKIGILNSQLSRIIASMGHTDKLTICDSGFPIPRDLETVDLALAPGNPGFIDTVKVVLGELQIESVVIAGEMQKKNRRVYDELVRVLPKVTVVKVPHEQFKRIAGSGPNAAYVRTGEATPYANVILVSGVTFG